MGMAGDGCAFSRAVRSSGTSTPAGAGTSGGATITRTQPPPRRAGPTDVSGPRKAPDQEERRGVSTKMLLSTRCTPAQPRKEFRCWPISVHLTPKSASPATSSKNFRLRRSKVPLRGTAGCLPAPALGGPCGQSQYSKRASSALPAHPKIYKACGAPEEEEKKGLHSKNHKKALAEHCWFCVPRSSRRASDRLALALARR